MAGLRRSWGGSVPTASWIHAAVDCAFLAVIIAISLALYIRGLGFYYDDYSVLSRMTSSDDQSLLGTYHAVRPATGQRPLQALTFATLYRVFGTDALGYHVANAFLLVGVAALLYLILRELRLPRVVCVAVPLVYSTFPHYATDRFWLDAFQINVSVACYLVSLFAGLRAVRSSAPVAAIWVAVAAAGIVGSLLAYEVIFPLFALNLGLIWWAADRRAGRDLNRGVVWVVLGALLAVMLAAGVTKTLIVAEEGQNSYRIGFQDGLLHHFAYLVSGAIKLNFGTYLVALPYVLWWIVRHQFSAANAAVAVLSGSLSFFYVAYLGRRERLLAERNTWRALVAVGLVAFVLGYAIFLTNQYVLFRSAGIDNRVNSGAALGLAGMFVGLLGWLTARLGREKQVAVFAATVACAVAAGVFVVDTLGSSWTRAAREQEAIVTGIVRASAATPSWRTLILDGVCTERGPAVVFADQWDLTGALRVRYPGLPLKADVAAEAMRATRRGLAVDQAMIDRVTTLTYPYGRALVVYDFAQHRLYRVPDRRRAVTYLRLRPTPQCPPQRSFAWGFDPLDRWSLL